MKKLIISILSVFIFTTCSFAQETMHLDTEKSVLYWMGSSLMGFNNHHGTVQFTDSHIFVKDGLIIGGTFTIDMNTITNKDGDYNEGLVDHLKNEDFFHVFLYPTAKLIIKDVVYENEKRIKMKADLSIKNSTQPIEFYAELDYESKGFTAEFSIDRTRWNIVYATSLVTSIKDNMLSNEIKFKVQLHFL